MNIALRLGEAKQIVFYSFISMLFSGCIIKSGPSPIEECVREGMIDWRNRVGSLKEVPPESTEMKLVMERCAKGLKAYSK